MEAYRDLNMGILLWGCLFFAEKKSWIFLDFVLLIFIRIGYNLDHLLERNQLAINF
jgi:hypothetical protein